MKEGEKKNMKVIQVGQEVQIGLSERQRVLQIAAKHGYVVNKFRAWTSMYEVRVDGESYFLFENEIVSQDDGKK